MSTNLLPHIGSPRDVKALSPAQLPALAQEMREYLIETLAPIGGHLGASLGVVELTIALHYVFNSPQDKIVWDVSHQAYPHKILTGRYAQMPTIRQYGGLSGFTKRSESEHDVFGAGHASTSISAAYGFALARDLQNKTGDVVAIIGDGALSGGMALEALNHAGARNNRLLVILNDNEMSIAPNVGAMSAYLSRVISGKPYTSAKGTARKLLDKLPGALDAMRRVEEHVKGMIMPGILFEELGMRYLGPIDGHDFEHLLPVLENCRELTGPLLLHVLTRKGLGYSPAEADPETWHGLGPYDRQQGRPISKAQPAPSYTSVFSDALCTLAEQDPRITAITAAMPAGTGLSDFAERFPARFFDVGIAEQHAVTFAAGLAADGMRPVVAIYSTFMQRAYDQLVHDVCIQNLPVIVCMDRAGIVGADGATHTGLLDLAFMRSMPHMMVMAPADEQELVDMLHTAVAHDGPVAIRYPRGTAVGVTRRPAQTLTIGSAQVVQKGNAGLIVSVGTRLQDVMQAAAWLDERQQQQLTVINLRFIKPLDLASILTHAVADQPVMVVEEGVAMGGVGEQIALHLLQHGWHGRFIHAAMPDSFPCHGTQQEILRDLQLDAEGLYQQWIGA
jgi:1-deoxy-D-xylulose-5-phosphate synthase